MAGAAFDAIRAGEIRGAKGDVGDAVPQRCDVGEHVPGVEEATAGGLVDELEGCDGVVAEADVVEGVEGATGRTLEWVFGEVASGLIYLVKGVRKGYFYWKWAGKGTLAWYSLEPPS